MFSFFWSVIGGVRLLQKGVTSLFDDWQKKLMMSCVQHRRVRILKVLSELSGVTDFKR